MKYGIIMAVVIIPIVGLSIGFIRADSYNRGYSDCRLLWAMETATQIEVVAAENARARQIVDSADDCDIKRMLCETARGGCDTARVCNTPD